MDDGKKCSSCASGENQTRPVLSIAMNGSSVVPAMRRETLSNIVEAKPIGALLQHHVSSEVLAGFRDFVEAVPLSMRTPPEFRQIRSATPAPWQRRSASMPLESHLQSGGINMVAAVGTPAFNSPPIDQSIAERDLSGPHWLGASTILDGPLAGMTLSDLGVQLQEGGKGEGEKKDEGPIDVQEDEKRKTAKAPDLTGDDFAKGVSKGTGEPGDYKKIRDPSTKPEFKDRGTYEDMLKNWPMRPREPRVKDLPPKEAVPEELPCEEWGVTFTDSGSISLKYTVVVEREFDTPDEAKYYSLKNKDKFCQMVENSTLYGGGPPADIEAQLLSNKTFEDLFNCEAGCELAVRLQKYDVKPPKPGAQGGAFIGLLGPCNCDYHQKQVTKDGFTSIKYVVTCSGIFYMTTSYTATYEIYCRRKA